MPHNWFKSFHRDWGLSCRDDEFTVNVIDYVRWRYRVGQSVERVLAALGHPCCYLGAGRIPPIGHASRALLAWATNFDMTGHRDVVVIPVTIDQARKISPRFVQEQLDLFDSYDD